jgi:hypothetical protein
MSDDFTVEDARRCRARRLARLARHGHVRNDGSTVMIAIPEDLVEALAKYCRDNNQSSEEACGALVRLGLQSADQSGADEIGEDDPDNEGGPDRQKEHQSIKETRSATMTAAETFKQKAELAGKIAGFIERGDFASAKECEKIFNAYERHQAAANAPTEEQQRQSLVDSIVRNGTRLMGR